MSSVRRIIIGLLASVGLLLAGAVAVPVANAQESAITTFVVHLSPASEIPGCPPGVESGAHGVAIVQVNAATGEIGYRAVASRLPAPIAGSPGAHIHGPAPTTGTAPIVVPFELTGRNTGLVAAGTTTNLALARAIIDHPENYYANVHTTACVPGTIRGQLG